jgi:TetR/AcrR family acrAB operon transcriptional repressor
MVRRTKADALATRHRLLDAAEHLFQERGVSRTSLNDIATAAGTTRGAIYWHFKDKADLFNAMMERVTLPLEGTLACTARTADTTANPLLSLRDSMMSALMQTASDEQTRRVFEVATHKVEYVSEMQAVRDRHLLVRNQCIAMTQEILQQAVQREGIALSMPLATAALGLHVIMDGLIQNWLLEPKAFDLVKSGHLILDGYLQGLGFVVPDGPAPQRRTAAKENKLASV